MCNGSIWGWRHRRADPKWSHLCTRFADLHLEVGFRDVCFVFMMQSVLAVPRRDLGRVIGNFAAYRDEIRRALDVLLFGF
jgi:hypothetical protein